MKTTFEKLYYGYDLSEMEAKQLLTSICLGELNSTQVSAVISFYTQRAISIYELKGFRNALLELSRPVYLEKECLDVCGTGGDQKNTFNISTLSAFVLAASGIPVAKHGNYGSSSVSGSSDILKYLGYEFEADPDSLNDELERFDLTFIHAPLFHPALKNVAAPRKELGLRTFFNLLGPLVNPAKVKYKYIGVYNAEVARLYNYVLEQENVKYTIVNSYDGYDEVSLTSAFKFISNNRQSDIEPMDLGFDLISQKDIHGGSTIEEAAKIFQNVLQNEGTEAQKNVVLVNSSLAMQCFNDKPFEECKALCLEAIESGRAYQLLNDLLKN
jgi:anthranilate phosphoribosyltransferase